MPVSTFVSARRSNVLVDELNREWSHLRTTRDADDAVIRWRCQEPVFAGAFTLDDVMEAAGCRGHNDAALGALLRLAQCGDTFAGRTMLQVMLGAAVRIAVRTVHMADQDLDEAIARAVSALWSVIHSYPVERRTKHANSISLDILTVLTPRRGAAHREREQTTSLDSIADRGESMADAYWHAWDSYTVRLPWKQLDPDLDQPGTHPPLLDEPGARRPHEQRVEFWQAAGIDAYQRADDEQLLLLLAWATRREVISKRDAQLLMALYSPSDTGKSPTAADLGGDVGLSPAAVRQRASRAVRQLRAAVQAYAASPITELALGHTAAPAPVPGNLLVAA